jgi:hypothetical protein
MNAKGWTIFSGWILDHQVAADKLSVVKITGDNRHRLKPNLYLKLCLNS